MFFARPPPLVGLAMTGCGLLLLRIVSSWLVSTDCLGTVCGLPWTGVLYVLVAWTGVPHVGVPCTGVLYVMWLDQYWLEAQKLKWNATTTSAIIIIIIMTITVFIIAGAASMFQLRSVVSGIQPALPARVSTVLDGFSGSPPELLGVPRARPTCTLRHRCACSAAARSILGPPPVTVHSQRASAVARGIPLRRLPIS